MVSENDAVFARVSPSDSLNASLDRLKGNSGAVQLVGLQPRQALDDFFLNGQSVGVKVSSKACPRDTLPDDGAASFALDGLKVAIHYLPKMILEVGK